MVNRTVLSLKFLAKRPPYLVPGTALVFFFEEVPGTGPKLRFLDPKKTFFKYFLKFLGDLIQVQYPPFKTLIGSFENIEVLKGGYCTKGEFLILKKKVFHF